MQFLGLGAMLLAQLGVSAATCTLSEVQAQIEAYQELNGTHVAPSDPQFGCTLACGFLAFSRPGKLSYPNSLAYELEESRYWRGSRRVACCADGGHAAFAGASNIEGGLTLDLRNLNQVVVSADKKQTSVGAGNVWYDVYTKLQPMGLTVVRGRVSAIGVGGLTLGGGISFFSNRYGWSCDNVNNFQAVFADGSIRHVHPHAYPDLYWALRGGGNNFGIVTRFDLATYPQGDMWAGSQAFLLTNETATAINNAFYHLAINSAQDPYAQIIIAYAYVQSQGMHVIASDFQYGKPTPNLAILNNFTSIKGPVADTLRVTNLTGLTLEFNSSNPGGFRQTYWTLTTGNDAGLMSEMAAIYQDEVEKIKDAPGIVPSAIFPPISTDMTKLMSKNGGNPLGLAGQGPLNLINIDISWSNEADDVRIITATQNMATRFAAAAKAKGLDHPYLYQNYEALQQDVFSSYGEVNLARLKSIQAKYDPTKAWQMLQPGYFKLG
ncbi:FAD binding domain-containing protein [Metarhizium anisopliae]